MDELERFIVEAKANGWVGAKPSGKKISPSKVGSHDITYDHGNFHYHDSFVGLSDFCGQEHVTMNGEAVWSMAYYGYLLNPDTFSGREAVTMLKMALTNLYAEGRFLGGFSYRNSDLEYRDTNAGDYRKFNGAENILKGGETAYELLYFGGLVKP